MAVQIGFFGRLGDLIGREIELESPPGDGSIMALRRHLADRFPAAAADFDTRAIRACVDDTIVPDSHILEAGQKVEFFPPLSGG